VKAVAVAAKGKGSLNLLRRVRVIGCRYGLSASRMDTCLAQLVETLDRYGCRPTLPVTVAAAQRNPAVIARYADAGVEFAVHGFYHVDHTRLSNEDQLAQLGRARRLLEANGVGTVGFRAPYLRANDATLDAIRETGFDYDASQALHWPIDPVLESDEYCRVLSFYGSLPAAQFPALPWTDGGTIRIPYSLPDDEAVVDRLHLSSDATAELWQSILRATYGRGELFTLGLHPERVVACAEALEAVLDAARSQRPKVWIARLDEIARWWRERATTSVVVRDCAPGAFQVKVRGPRNLTVLARDLEVDRPEPWADGYVRVTAMDFSVRADRRPVIGVHPSCPNRLATFLREQGYVVETAAAAATYAAFFCRDRFTQADELPLLGELEDRRVPVVRFGRWPDGARSALAVTGDVDALTIRDYALRALGH
jgi:peptidoglycan/xylan/chitin deacetylase (PgdA/CDA1 family)